MGYNLLDDHGFEEGLWLFLGVKPIAANPDAGASTRGEAQLWINSSTKKLNYKTPDGVNHELPLAAVDDALALHLAGAEEVTGAKTFDDATLLLFNAAKTFKATLHSLATANRSVSLPDASGNALVGLGNALGGIRVLTSVGHNNVGAATLTGAKVGDVVIGVSNVTDHATLLPGVDFEATITVNDQIQQLSVANLSAKTIFVLLAANA